MKQKLSFLICIILVFSIFNISASALDDDTVPYVIDFIITTDIDTYESYKDDSRATGLIASYGLNLTKTGTTLNIYGVTQCSPEVIKCGFKNLVIQRRKTSSDSWENYYEYGNVYVEATAAGLSTTLVVESGYQYRISCKHYAKKNILSVQTVANTSNIVTVA